MNGLRRSPCRVFLLTLRKSVSGSARAGAGDHDPVRAGWAIGTGWVQLRTGEITHKYSCREKGAARTHPHSQVEFALLVSPHLNHRERGFTAWAAVAQSISPPQESHLLCCSPNQTNVSGTHQVWMSRSLLVMPKSPLPHDRLMVPGQPHHLLPPVVERESCSVGANLLSPLIHSACFDGNSQSRFL